jgi:hypothetical protein
MTLVEGLAAQGGKPYVFGGTFEEAVEVSRIREAGALSLAACRIAWEESPIGRFMVLPSYTPRAVYHHRRVPFGNSPIYVGEVAVILEPLPVRGWLPHTHGIYTRPAQWLRWIKQDGKNSLEAAIASAATIDDSYFDPFLRESEDQPYADPFAD